ncbi:MAG: hypothetical protein ACLFWL_05940 [Candidatus Brocadiia bacterium]
MIAGTATVDITPPEGARIACFPIIHGEKARRAEGVHMPLLANILFLSDGGTSVALCSCDLALIRLMDVRRIRREVGETVPELDGPQTIVAATHTHSGPENTYLFGTRPGDDEVQVLNSRIASAVVEATRSTELCSLSLGAGQLELSHNRRVTDEDGRSRMVLEHVPGETEGPVDPTLLALSCNSSDEIPIGILFNWTAHALTLGPECRWFSPDYPGVARSRIQENYDAVPVLFFNGAAGNVHPQVCMRADTSAAEDVGSRLGSEVLNLLEFSEQLDANALSFRSRVLTFPSRVQPDIKVEVEISVLELGSVLFAFVPGEVFVEFQLEFRRGVDFEHVFFVGYANGWPGYIPTREAYKTGGYGVELRENDPPEFCRTALPPGAGEEILEALSELV